MVLTNARFLEDIPGLLYEFIYQIMLFCVQINLNCSNVVNQFGTCSFFVQLLGPYGHKNKQTNRYLTEQKLFA